MSGARARCGGLSWLMRARRAGRSVSGAVAAMAAAAALLGFAPAGTAAGEEAGGAFSDDDGSVHESALDALAARGVLEGIECGEGLICPDEPLRRWEMAVWLVRVLDGADPAPAAGASGFADVGSEIWWAPHVDRLREIEVTAGCATEPDRFCPLADVTRAQMATFLTRAFDLEPASSAGFTDVSGGPHAASIDRLAAAGVTAGCGRDPQRYCPADNVTRAQMATFVVRALSVVETAPQTRYTAVDIGDNQACALRSDAAVVCWGIYLDGRTNAPGGQFSAISVGGAGACGIRPGGAVVCWADTAGSPPPADQFEAVDVGVFFADGEASGACGLRLDSTVACWGDNEFGQTEAPGGEFSMVSASGLHSCGLRVDGTVDCWGRDNHGQAEAPGTRYRAVTVGAWHSCGLRTDSTVDCWGDGSFGQTDAPGGRFASVSAGFWHSCGLRTDSTVDCWGDGISGETDAPGGRFAAVSAGVGRSCGLRPDGTAECWGRDHSRPWKAPPGRFSSIAPGPRHQCGVRVEGTVDCWGFTGAPAPPGGQFLKVATGDSHSCGIRADGTVDCWGSSIWWPGRARSARDDRFIDVAAGGGFSCGVRADNTLECWGHVPAAFRRTIRGQFSSVSAGGDWMCGVRLDGSLVCEGGSADPPEGRFASVSTGVRSACGVRVDGEIVCWGTGSSGHLDAPSGPFASVAVADGHVCGLREDGAAECWGHSPAGQTDAPDAQFQAVAAAGFYSCGLRPAGDVVCWGRPPWLVSAPAGVSRFAPASIMPDPKMCWPPGYFGFPHVPATPSTTGKLRVAVLFVDFPDAPALISAQQEDLRGLTHAKRYLESASYRKLRIDWAPLHRWLRAERAYLHYSYEYASFGWAVTNIDPEAVRLADPDFDFSGVGAVLIVLPSAHFSGGNAGGVASTEEGSATTSRINTFHGGPGPRYQSSGLSRNWGYVGAHELAHNLGLADLYPYRTTAHFVPQIAPVGKKWQFAHLGLMGLTAAVPVSHRETSVVLDAPEMLAWSRWQLGWLEADQIACINDTDATVELSPVADPGDGIAMAAVPVSTVELIVVESRRRLGYDERAPLGDGRVVVYTVDANIRGGDLPIKLAGDTGRGHTQVSPILAVGESVTVYGYTITVLADDGDTHTVSITKTGDG